MTSSAPTSLVIDTRKLSRLCLDGPALKVVMQSRSSVLFPIRRLLRIHVIGTPGSGMDALLHCAEQRVPVAFFHLNGRLRCRLQPPVSDNALVDHWLEHVQFDPEVAHVYSEWLLHQGLHTLSLLGFNAGACDSRRQLVYEALRGLCRQALGREGFRDALDWLDGLLHFHLEHVIEEFGLSRQQSGKQKLLSDIKPICELWLLYCLAGHLQKRRGFRVSPRNMTAFYQEQHAQIESSARRMLIQLISRLEAIV